MMICSIPPFHFSLHPSIYPFIYPSIYLLICLSIYLSYIPKRNHYQGKMIPFHTSPLPKTSLSPDSDLSLSLLEWLVSLFIFFLFSPSSFSLFIFPILLFIPPSIYLSIHLSIYLSNSISNHLSVCPSICLHPLSILSFLLSLWVKVPKRNHYESENDSFSHLPSSKNVTIT